MLPDSHRDQIAADLRRERTLYVVVLVGVALELGIGLFLWSELRALGAAPDRSAPLWIAGLALISAVQLGAAAWANARLRRPSHILARLREGLAEAGLTAEPPPELLTVVAIRASFVADVIVWVLLQFVTIYGLVGVVMTGALAALLGFTALSALALVLAAPRARRVEALAEALQREVARAAA